ncbi:unnamed protein product [Periconia digitata]|uniref:Thiamine-binding protein domain-containing protein n=1 Tax=Periconia digitata TaxID=1303443 RepID=A0A9W4UUY0_9PLEO|nr:unnamed protein product [Periconia digitata]
MSVPEDLTTLQTPPSCTADFCLIPLGTPTASVSQEVAAVQRLLKKSGISYQMHAGGTTLGTSTLSSLLSPPYPISHIL